MIGDMIWPRKLVTILSESTNKYSQKIKGETLIIIVTGTIHFFSSESDICPLLHFGYFGSKITNYSSIFPNIVLNNNNIYPGSPLALAVFSGALQIINDMLKKTTLKIKY